MSYLQAGKIVRQCVRSFGLNPSSLVCIVSGLEEQQRLLPLEFQTDCWIVMVVVIQIMQKRARYQSFAVSRALLSLRFSLPSYALCFASWSNALPDTAGSLVSGAIWDFKQRRKQGLSATGGAVMSFVDVLHSNTAYPQWLHKTKQLYSCNSHPIVQR